MQTAKDAKQQEDMRTYPTVRRVNSTNRPQESHLSGYKDMTSAIVSHVEIICFLRANVSRAGGKTVARCNFWLSVTLLFSSEGQNECNEKFHFPYGEADSLP